jgi:hypothetical protein
MQVTSDGSYAAFTATSRITGYDSHGVEEMYRYNASTGGLVCVSCVPTGDKPTGPVFGSENGLFITTDGRTFFSTADALSPDDTNEAQDVYEYVGGRPQLITQGTGEVTEALCPQCGLGQFSAAGLIGVSADGQDVYFGTYDVLTPQDHNGGNLKIYDARTNGGFNFEPPPPPCEAADECHGNAAGPPPPLAKGTTVDLGDQGNIQDPGKAQRCAKKARAAQRASKHATALRRRATGVQALQRKARQATLAAKRLRKRASQCGGRHQKKRKRSQHKRKHVKRGASK